MQAPAAPAGSQQDGPLAGFVVLDLSRVLSGPYCTMMLRDLGATVIKVEQPLVGDEARHFLPIAPDGRSAYFAAINRGKKSIALDLKDETDRRVLDQLIARADVMVENFRPGVLDKLGLGHAALSARHPRLVYASISGFGQTGPYRTRAAYDVVVQAMSGMMSITGHPGGAPTRTGSSIGDLAAAMFMCSGIQSALLQRARTGLGAHVDVAMFDAQIALLEGAIPELFCSGASPGPIGARHSGAAPFDAFRAGDGHLVIAAGSDHLFAALASVLGSAGLTDMPQFSTRALRVANHAELKAVIEQRLAQQPVAHWLGQLERAGVPAGPLNDVATMMRDPQVASRGVLPPIEGGAGQRAPVTPIVLSGRPYPAQLPPVPALDAHREAILRFAAGEATALD
ncbi:CaiB/BaiF CoA transferase family protein [Comamonas endophytica]|uniref:CoA transferase n=1 Tax=Comamonas endophytica TaxID=2949090 RepID=A0ABY6GEP3_9BURK|nr:MULTISPECIES: CoA transferase [unclassified Acidovorax]MCD2514312.1 CoA transferase [Acidovorax sp. D4N7]UYG53561.1 CoA transferase [Acidovorax sp. 5MLIR]